MNLSGWKKGIAIYLVVLIASHITVALWGSPIRQSNEPDQSVEIQIASTTGGDSSKVQLPYQDVYNGKKKSPQVLLLLPGGPEGPGVFESLTGNLSAHYRIIIPHIAEAGNWRNKLPDYSFKSRAEYVNQLIQQLNLTGVQLVGFELGGANAINLAHTHPDEIKSLSLISSIGVQELQLLGSYQLNHAVYGVQLAAVWMLQNAVPHFGLLNSMGFNSSYAKSYYESDQRPLRKYLRQYKKPLLILHGSHDPFVPLAAAQEHHRIVPQSQLKVFNADHDLIETQSDSVGAALTQFITAVDKNNAISYKNASKQRKIQAESSFSNIEFKRFKGASLLIILLIIVLGTLLSEDLTCIGAGLLAARGLIGFWPAAAACFVGIFVGDMGLYLAGRLLGQSATQKAPFKWFVSEQDLINSAEWFEERGATLIFATRFLPGSRLPTYFSAGVIGADFKMFASYFLLAAGIWTPMLVGISKLLGNRLLAYFALYQDYALLAVLATILLVVMIVKVIVPVFTHKGRRILISRYRRLTCWEYWPSFLLYIPVFFYVIYLGIKYRSLTLFTAANPSVPAGGFVGESKTEMLEQFSTAHVASYELIQSDWEFSQKMETVQQFMQTKNLAYPVVLKPDVGQRGKGVEIIRDNSQAEEYLNRSECDTIVQEYRNGKEFGIFYYRRPSQEMGNIFSITQKHLLKVTGDGDKTIEELILDDNQAVTLAKYHLRANKHKLYDIPKNGEVVPIVELGTHARGAVFSEGQSLITDALTQKMNEICAPASGFYFGRFDIKVPSKKDLKKGEQLSIIEVNGITSESTNIYDSSYSFWDAQQILQQQWALAFQISQENREQGAQPASITKLLKEVVNYILGFVPG